MSIPKEPQSLQPSQAEDATENPGVPKNIPTSAPCSGQEDNRPGARNHATEVPNMRNCCSSDLSADARIGALDNRNQKEAAPEMDKRPSEVTPVATSTGLLRETMIGRQPSEEEGSLSLRKVDHIKKQDLSRTDQLFDDPHKGGSASVPTAVHKRGSASVPTAVRADKDTHSPIGVQDSKQESLKDSTSQQCLTASGQDTCHTPAFSKQGVEFTKPASQDAPTESITKELIFSDTDPAPSHCPQTKIKQSPENTKVDASQLKSEDSQVPLPRDCQATNMTGHVSPGDVSTKRTQAEVKHGNIKDSRHQAKLGQVTCESSTTQDSHLPPASSSLPSGVCTGTEESSRAPPGREIASKLTAKEMETKTCGQEENQVLPQPCTQKVDSDVSQDAASTFPPTASHHSITSQPSLCTMDPKKEGTPKEHIGDGDAGAPGMVSKTDSFKLASPQHNVGTQADTRAKCKSVAVSPIIPPGAPSSFTFQAHVGKRASPSPKSSPKGPPGKKVARTVDTISKTSSFELTPPQQEVGTQAGSRVECKSVAISPIIPPGVSSAFTFQTDKGSPCSPSTTDRTAGQDSRNVDTLKKTYSFELTPPQQDVGTQADTRVECVSVAVSPIIPPDGSSSFPFQVDKGKQESASRKSSSNEDTTRGKVVRTLDALSKTCSFELTPPQQDVGSQADTQVECKSVAVSPIIIPLDGSPSFTFQADKENQQSISPKSSSRKDQTRDTEVRTQDVLSQACSFELTPPQQEVGTQADTQVECISVAVSPIIPPDGPSSFTFQTREGSQRSTSSKNTSEDQTEAKVARTMDTISKTYSFELTPPQQDEGTQVDTRVECKSVAVSPIIPPDGASAFSFQSDKGNQGSPSQKSCLKDQPGPKEGRTADTFSKTYSFELTPPQHDEGTQVDTRVECKSVAVSPIIPPEGSSSFTFQTEKKKQGSPSLGKPLIKDPTTEKGTRAEEMPSKTCSFELTPPQQDVGTQADTRPECTSIAISPIIPPDGSSSFTFQADKRNHEPPALKSSAGVDQTKGKEVSSVETLSKTCSFKLTSPQQDVGTQAGTRVECKSAAVSPINPPGEVSSFPFSDRTNQGSSSLNIASEAQTRDKESYSIEITPPQQDVGTQVDNRVHCTSVAVSPIIPPDGSASFIFQSGMVNQEPPLSSANLEQIPSRRDAEMQVSILVETRSVATGPMTPTGKSPQTSYPDVHVKGAKEEQSEPIREVSWDEKGMTWEVYGASMEVEVLGMAIQKHLEKQIEEHGRQKVMTPQNTRASSIRGAPAKGDVKRPPSMFRTLLHNVRRPRCCSRAGPTVE